MKLDLDLKGTDELARAFRLLEDRAPRALGAAMYREAEQIMAKSKELVPVDEATLKTSGYVQPPDIQGHTVTVTLGYGGAASGYAINVHEGTGPAVGRPAFFPPVDVISDWVVRHGMPEEAAFPAARAIGQRGLRPLKFLERPLLEAQNGMDQRLAHDLWKEFA